MNAASKKKKIEAENELREMGATLERKEDRFGDTKSGWWLDGVYLGLKNDPAHCLRIVKGD